MGGPSRFNRNAHDDGGIMHNVQWLEKMRTDSTVPAKVRGHLASALQAEKSLPRRAALRKARDAYRLELERSTPWKHQQRPGRIRRLISILRYVLTTAIAGFFYY